MSCLIVCFDIVDLYCLVVLLVYLVMSFVDVFTSVRVLFWSFWFSVVSKTLRLFSNNFPVSVSFEVKGFSLVLMVKYKGSCGYFYLVNSWHVHSRVQGRVRGIARFLDMFKLDDLGVSRKFQDRFLEKFLNVSYSTILAAASPSV